MHRKDHPTPQVSSVGCTDRVVIPLKRKLGKSIEVPVKGGTCYPLSRVTIQQQFAMSPGIASTVHKAQGRTIDKVIVALSRRSNVGPDNKFLEMSYEAVYVAMTRVQRCDDIRLLLHGADDTTRRTSLLYLSNLIPNPKVKAFFAGYGAHNVMHPNTEPKQWNEAMAIEAYHRM